MTSFSQILRGLVETTPGALGGVFSAEDGEVVDWFAINDTTEWPALAAHYGIVFRQAKKALFTFHYGEIQSLVAFHSGMDIMVSLVQDGYYALIGLTHPGPIARATATMTTAVAALRKEMQ